MDNNPAAFGAVFTDLKFVRGRAVAQFIFEVPIEAAGHAIKVTGMPDNSMSKWFGIAEMKKKPDAV